MNPIELLGSVSEEQHPGNGEQPGTIPHEVAHERNAQPLAQPQVAPAPVFTEEQLHHIQQQAARQEAAARLSNAAQHQMHAPPAAYDPYAGAQSPQYAAFPPYGLGFPWNVMGSPAFWNPYPHQAAPSHHMGSQQPHAAPVHPVYGVPGLYLQQPTQAQAPAALHDHPPQQSQGIGAAALQTPLQTLLRGLRANWPGVQHAALQTAAQPLVPPAQAGNQSVSASVQQAAAQPAGVAPSNAQSVYIPALLKAEGRSHAHSSSIPAQVKPEGGGALGLQLQFNSIAGGSTPPKPRGSRGAESGSPGACPRNPTVSLHHLSVTCSTPWTWII